MFLLSASALTVASLGISSALPPFSISGHSSGGSMASNHFAAFSSTVEGLGHLQAAPFGCAAQASDPQHKLCTTSPSRLSVDKLVSYAAAAHAAGKIDDPANWASTPIYLYAGEADSVVNADVVRKAAELYGADFTATAAGAAAKSGGGVTLHVQPGAQHAFSTDVAGYGNECGGLASPFINYCDYDGAGAVLNTIYSDLKPRVDPIDSHIVSIDQAQYLEELGWKAADASMADTAYAYVPSGCSADASMCRIHVVYHGCLSYFGAVQDAIYVHTGYNNWAEANDILVLYPQTVAKMPENWQGCWDWYGFLNKQFDTKEGVQIQAVNAMVAALRDTVAGEGVQSQLRDYPHSYHNPETTARAMADATERATRCEAASARVAAVARAELAGDIAASLDAAAAALAGDDIVTAAMLINTTQVRLRVLADR